MNSTTWWTRGLGGFVIGALAIAGLSVPATAEPTSSGEASTPALEVPAPTNTPSTGSGAGGGQASTPVETVVGEGTIAPSTGATISGDEFEVTFSGAQVQEDLAVKVTRLDEDVAKAAAFELGKDSLSAVFDVDARDAAGLLVTSFPSTVGVNASVPEAMTAAAGGEGEDLVTSGPTPGFASRQGAPTVGADGWPVPVAGVGSTPAEDASGFDVVPSRVTPVVEGSVTPGVLVEIPIDPSALEGVDHGSIRIATREDATQSWTVLPSYLDVERSVVVAQLDHLSQFVVIGQKDVATPGPRIVLDPDNNIANTTGPGGPATEFGYNVALANQVAAKLQQACLADVLVTRTDTSTPMLDQSVRAGMANAHNPVLTATLAFDAALGSPWGNIGNGGSKIYSRGSANDIAVAVSLLDTMPLYTGRPANGVERPDLPYDDFGGVPGALVHLETLYLDHNFDRPVIDAGFENIVNGVFTSMGKYLETQGFNCTDPNTGGGWPAPPSLDQIKSWMQLGFKNYAAYGGDPFNFSTGNLVSLEDLFTTSGPGGFSSQTALVHNSQDNRLSRLGQGWSATFNARAQRFADGSVMVVRGDGSSYQFTPDGAGGFLVDANHGARLVDVGGNRLELRVDDQSVWVFDTSHPEGVGDLVEIRDGTGSRTTLTYAPLTGDPLFRSLTGIILPGGQSIAVTSNAEGLITGLSASDGRTWTLTYDTGRHLVGLTFPDATAKSFVYDAAGRITAAVDATGTTYVTNVYDESGRVLSQGDAAGHTRTLAYGAGTTVYTDAEGQVWTYTWDERSRVTGFTDPLGQTTSFGYGALDVATSVRDADGAQTTIVPDAAGRPLQVTDPAGAVSELTYDASGWVIQTITPANNEDDLVTTLTRDAQGRPLSATVGDLPASEFTYDSAGNLTSATDAAGETTTFTYDERGNLLSMSDALDQTSSFTYDAGNRVLTRTSPSGAVMSYGYDAAGRLSSETDPDGATTTYAYDALGRLTSTTDALGGLWSQEWDALWRVTATIDPTGARTTYTYNAEDTLESVTDPLGATTTYTLDAAYRTVAVTDPLGGQWASTLDPVGRVLAQSDPTGGEMVYTYDEAGRVTTVIDADGVEQSYTWDVAGNLATVTDGAGSLTTMTYDALGRPLSVTDPDGATTTQVWNAVGQVTAVIDPLEQESTTSYDAIGQVTSETDRTGAKSTFAYNADGFLTRVVDADGVAITFEVDWAGQVLSEEDNAGRAWVTAYDALGRVISETDPLGGESTYAWDAAHNLTSVTDPLGNVTSYGWDAAGRQVSTTNADGIITGYSYDAAGQLAKVIRNLHPDAPEAADVNLTTTYAYTASGLMSSMTNPNGATWTTQYTPGGRTASQTNPLGAVSSIVWDERGLPATQSDADGRTATNTYTPAGQLAQTVHTAPGLPERVESFVYNPVGDLVSMTDPTGTTTFTYDGEGRVLEQVQPGGTISLTLSAAGRTTHKQLADGSKIDFTYDTSGLPATASNPLGTETYVYDEAARLTKVSRQGESGTPVVTDYVLDANGRPTQITHTAATTTPALSPTNTGGLNGLTKCLPVPDYLAERTLPGAGSTPGIESIDLTYTYNPTGTVATTGRIDSGNGKSITSQSQTATYDGMDRLVATQTDTTHLEAASTAPAGQRAALTSTTTTGSDSSGCGLIAGVGYPTPTAVDQTSTASETFTWDQAGNRTGMTSTKGEVTTQTLASFNELNQVTATETSRGGLQLSDAAYTYDQAGNRTSETLRQLGTLAGQNPELLTTLTYDAAGQLATETRPESTSTYQRDALGRLTVSTQSTAVQERSTTYTWDGLTLAGQTDSIHGATSYLPDAFARTTGQTGTPANPTGSWLLADNLDSTLAMATPTGTINQVADWGTFGAFDAHTTGWDTTIGYTGEQTNPATGTVSFYARNYDPTTATFTTTDHWEGLLNLPETLNRYAYVLGNPLTLVDILKGPPALAGGPSAVGGQDAGSRSAQ